MKSQALSCSLIASAAREFGFNPKMDISTVIDRVACEGYEFLSIALPRLSDILLEGLESSVLPTFVGWNKKRGTRVPEFLQDLWLQVFHPSGEILHQPSVRAIYWIRQISCAFKKVFEVCADEYIVQAIDSFLRVDRELPRRIPEADTLSQVAHWLFGKPVGRAVCAWETVFRQGPGAVADRLDVNERWDFPTISHSIYAAFGADRFRATWHDLRFHHPLVRDTPARMVAVPKTATKPRLISIEPAHNQYLQQSMMSALYDQMSRMFPVNIREQGPNQDLARVGSVDRSLATIDLSDASDRIPNELVEKMFEWNKPFSDFLQVTRSYELDVPGVGSYFLRKFASMGSALTFPVETMVFATIVITGMCIQDGDLSRKNALRHFFSHKVRVYGDDIILPSSYYQSVVRLLSRCGSSVNDRKSYHRGLFRESCGKDWFSGIDVTPNYVRRSVEQGHLSDETLTSLVSLHNQFFERNGESPTTDLLRRWIVDSLPGIPTISLHSSRRVGGLYLLGHSDEYRMRRNPHLMTTEVKTYFPSVVIPTTKGTERGKLLKSLKGGFNEDPEHLYRGGRPVSARLKYGWRELL